MVREWGTQMGEAIGAPTANGGPMAIERAPAEWPPAPHGSILCVGHRRAVGFRAQTGTGGLRVTDGGPARTPAIEAGSPGALMERISG
jgi:hypothetical protein